MQKSKYGHVFKIIDHLVADAVCDLSEDGTTITCRSGCDHCCHLLVEISWEEAVELARWLLEQPVDEQRYFVEKLKDCVEERRELFSRKRKTKKFMQSVSAKDDFPESIFDEYFDEKSRPCPFLVESHCAAYDLRPSPCRFHLVASDPSLCARGVEDNEDYEVPERVEEAKEYAEPIIVSKQDDGRYGELSIIVLEALREIGLPLEEAELEDAEEVEQRQNTLFA